MKQRIFVVSFLLLMYIVAYCQIGRGVIVGGKLAVYKTAEDTSGRIIIARADSNKATDAELLADSASNAFYIVDIIESCKNRFLVKISSSDTDSLPFSIDSVWIPKNNVGVGLAPKNIDGKPMIPLYYKPSFRSKLSMLPQGAAYSIAQVCDCKERWLKIRIRGTKNEIVGWLPPENQCVNMYSMCCGN